MVTRWVIEAVELDQLPVESYLVAGVQAAALLIAAKRADAISSEIAMHTERNTDDIKGLVNENTALTEIVKRNTDLLEEIHRHGLGPGGAWDCGQRLVQS